MEIEAGIITFNFNEDDCTIDGNQVIEIQEIKYEKQHDKPLTVLLFISGMEMDIETSIKVKVIESENNKFKVECKLNIKEYYKSLSCSYIAFQPIDDIVESEIIKFHKNQTIDFENDIENNMKIIYGFCEIKSLPSNVTENIIDNISLNKITYNIDGKLSLLKISNGFNCINENFITEIKMDQMNNYQYYGKSKIKEYSFSDYCDDNDENTFSMKKDTSKESHQKTLEFLPVLKSFDIKNQNSFSMKTFYGRNKKSIIFSSNDERKLSYDNCYFDYSVILINIKTNLDLKKQTTKQKPYTSEKICMMCQNEIANCVFTNCHHVCVCNDCFNQLTTIPFYIQDQNFYVNGIYQNYVNYKCPLCETWSTDVIQIQSE